MAADLTILVPTYRRPLNLSNLLKALTQALTELGRQDVQILVSDNCSRDDTAEVVSFFSRRHGNVRYFCHDQHYPTGEENLFFALPEVPTEYVWFFSDDDIPDVRGVDRVLQAVALESYDFIQLNCRYVDTDGVVTTEALIESASRPYYATTIERLVAMHGWLHLSAMFSSGIMRTARIRAVDIRHFLSISPIYAHVAAYISAFSGRPALFVSAPSVSYTFGLDFEEGGHWKFYQIAKGLGTFPSYFWSLGLIRLIAALEDAGDVPPGYLLQIVEVTHHSSFTLANHTLIVICDQLLQEIAEPRQDGCMRLEDLEAVAVAYARGDQRYVEIFNRLRRVLEVISDFRPGQGGGGLFSRAAAALGREPMRRINSIVDDWAAEELRRLKDRVLAPPPPLQWVAEHRGYDVYDSGLGLQAQNRSTPSRHVERLGFREAGPDILTAADMKVLRAKIDAALEGGLPTRAVDNLESQRVS